jgi:hypothetical protein
MFNSCAACRRRLARRAEGSLPRSQWAALEAHLTQCANCRRIDEVDRAMHLMLSRSQTTYGRMTSDAASAFDDRVLNQLLNQPKSLWRQLLEDLMDRLRLAQSSVAAMFIGQVAGGAIAAAAITTCGLLVAIQPHAIRKDVQVHNRPELSANERWLTGPPVPLEALLDSPSPRAAMLWTLPSREAKVTEIDRKHTNSIGGAVSDSPASQNPSHL